MTNPDVVGATGTIFDALKPFPALTALIEPLRDIIASQGNDSIEWFGVNAGTVLFRTGDPAEDAFVVLSGRLGVITGVDPGELPIAYISPGEIVGEMGLISHEPRSATVIALRDSNLLRIPRPTAELLLRSSHEVAVFLLRLLAARLRTTIGHHQGRAISSIAIVPLVENCLDDRIAENLTAAFGSICTTVKVVSRDGVENDEDRFQSGDISQTIALYQGDHATSGWTRHCIRQSDHVIFIANSDTPAANQDVIDLAKQLHRAAELMLLNPANVTYPSGATAWLEMFPPDRVLHARAGNHDDCKRVARLACGRSIGLVLSGGGARAFAHIGVLKAFLEAGVPIDLVAGNSMGSLVAALLALDHAPEGIGTILRETFVETNPFGDYTVPVISLSRGRKMNRLLKRYCGSHVIENLWRSFFCVSANLSTGSLHVHDKGLLWQALRASSAIPGIYPPWIEDGHVLVDGGVINNFPTTVMREMRRGRVVGVDVAPETTFRANVTEIEEKSLPWLVLKGHQEAPSVLRILARVALINGDAQTAASRAAADLLIHPDVHDIPILSFKAIDKAFEAGHRAALAAIPQLQQLLPNAAAAASLDRTRCKLDAQK